MSLRREQFREGWLILSAGRPWDDWVYPTEGAAKATAERCGVEKADVIKGKRQGYFNGRKQFSARMLFDRKRRTR
ncbi:hypothetical protein L2449_16710 [Mesorhizobium muleiense]|uniref:hypothetical protein n=1 Tax=Mesorhizobium muleiense TaxID=1004279 RepID=UPI001F3FA5E2|nr:hypothetical protein [Mesorhizobium muleiense]MCF6118520.1 hypothetical protein [Mesorhizobium muleiense]